MQYRLKPLLRDKIEGPFRKTDFLEEKESFVKNRLVQTGLENVQKDPGFVDLSTECVLLTLFYGLGLMREVV